jgi:hypothetical protein
MLFPILYRYFLRKFGDYYSELYRILRNGKTIINNIPVLEKYISTDKWSNDSKNIRGLLEERAIRFTPPTTTSGGWTRLQTVRQYRGGKSGGPV